jgi:tyrosyl-tRNA synthetase
MRLARQIVAIYHGEDAAKKAEEEFENTFKKGEVPENISDS